jgi:hypothetical protein
LKYIFSIVFLLFVSCKKKEVLIVIEEEPIEGLSLFDEKHSYVFNEELSIEINEKIKDWDEYSSVSSYLKNNYTLISPSLSLEMSKELSDLVKTMKDSLQIKALNNRGVFARIYTLNSEALRLKDMSSISSIKASEVSLQVEKVVAIYNSINSKINSVYAQQSFDQNIDFDEAIFNFNIDREIPYSTPKKSKRTRTISKNKQSYRK